MLMRNRNGSPSVRASLSVPLLMRVPPRRAADFGNPVIHADHPLRQVEGAVMEPAQERAVADYSLI